MPALPADLPDQVSTALEEDIGQGDRTASLIDESSTATAEIIAREPAILCGCAWLDEVYKQLDSEVSTEWHKKDGDLLQTDQSFCKINGPSSAILTGERTALNFLQTLSGTATTTHHFVKLISHSKTRILDTRKTLPGLRTAQKYAVLCGGGKNHRMGLFDAILIKENHIAAAGGITVAINAAREENVPIQVEVENLDQLQEALNTGVDSVLLDNFTVEHLTNAVVMNQEITNGKTVLEASGNIDESTIEAIAATGVDYISIGALTKHVRAIDFSMRIK